MFWNRKATPQESQTRQVGLDLNASRARAVSILANRTRSVLLDDTFDELPLFVDLTRRPPLVGRTGFKLCRKLPHLACSNFLPLLGRAKQWQSGRMIVTPEIALSTTFEQLRKPLSAESEGLALALPGYLTPMQVKSTLELARQAKLPIVGSASAPVAIAAHRAAYLLSGSVSENDRPDWVVPIRPNDAGPGSIVLLDCDEYAMSVAVVQLEAQDVKLQAFAVQPRLSLKIWKERLLDALSDQCVRLCRRDPRDSAEAEQFLYEQLDLALDQSQAGLTVRLTVRSEHWYQDLVKLPEELSQYCQSLGQQSADCFTEAVRSAELSSPPRAVWLSHSAAKLPGLAQAIYQHSAEQTALQSLPAQAAADAVAWLIRRWKSGELPKAHLDGVVPLEVASASPSTVAVPRVERAQ